MIPVLENWGARTTAIGTDITHSYTIYIYICVYVCAVIC